MKAILCAALALAFFVGSSKAEDDQIPVRVVVLTTFQAGADDDPTAGEFGNWVKNLPLPNTIPFPQGYHALRYNPDLQVLGVVMGEGKAHSAASVMALGMDPRFDLSKAYWIVAAIAGVNPHRASLASVAWAKYVVDGDLGAYAIDAREIPQGWSTGYVPIGRNTPYQPPPPPFESISGHTVFLLNTSLIDWAFQQTSSIQLPDDANLQQVRAGWSGNPNAVKPPFVLEGDDMSSDIFWVGDLLNTWAENWLSYWTSNQANFVMTAFEDTAVNQAIQFLGQAGKADPNRVLVLRSGSDFNFQPNGITPAQYLALENNFQLSGFLESLNNVYAVGSVVVKKISNNWSIYRDQIPSPGH
jgi:purine nucleoside permease